MPKEYGQSIQLNPHIVQGDIVGPEDVRKALICERMGNLFALMQNYQVPATAQPIGGQMIAEGVILNNGFALDKNTIFARWNNENGEYITITTTPKGKIPKNHYGTNLISFNNFTKYEEDYSDRSKFPDFPSKPHYLLKVYRHLDKNTENQLSVLTRNGVEKRSSEAFFTSYVADDQSIGKLSHLHYLIKDPRPAVNYTSEGHMVVSPMDESDLQVIEESLDLLQSKLQLPLPKLTSG